MKTQQLERVVRIFLAEEESSVSPAELRVASSFLSRQGEEAFAPIKEQMPKVKSALAKHIAAFEVSSKRMLGDYNVVDDLDVKDRYGEYLTLSVIISPEPLFKLVRSFMAGVTQVVSQSLMLPPKVKLLAEKALTDHFKDFQVDKLKDKWDITKTGDVPGMVDAGSETKFNSGEYYDWDRFTDYLKGLIEHSKQALKVLSSLQGDLDKYLEDQKAHAEVLQQRSQVRQESKEKAKAEVAESKMKSSWSTIYNDAPKIVTQITAAYDQDMRSLKSQDMASWSEFPWKVDYLTSHFRKALKAVSKHLQGNGAAELSNRLEALHKGLTKAANSVAKTPVVGEYKTKSVTSDNLKKAFKLITDQLEKVDAEVKAVWTEWQAKLKAMI